MRAPNDERLDFKIPIYWGFIQKSNNTVSQMNTPLSLFIRIFLSYILILLIYPLQSLNNEELFPICQDISQAYDLAHPSYANRSVILPHFHSKRCTLQQIEYTSRAFLNDKYKHLSRNEEILVHSPCLGSDSIGNYLGDYFENILCAKYVNIHYCAVAKVWEPKRKDRPPPFVANLPTQIANGRDKSIQPWMDHQVKSSKELIKLYCKCQGSCHEKDFALWTKGTKYIREIFHNSLQYHLQATQTTRTIVRQEDLSNMNIGTMLPLVPTVAIHYRCGDNFVGYYGFLPFHQIISRIPQDAKNIFVFAEKKTRKTSTRTHAINICDSIFQKLFETLRKYFPNSSVLIQRGGDLYADMARLTYADVLICSVSTFCLWPAIASNGTAYFPKTKLISGGNTNLRDLGFQWITEPRIVLGVEVERMAPNNVVGLLTKSLPAK